MPEIKNTKISILVPVFNEEKTIDILLEQVINQVKDWNAQIIVINDGSTDRTLQKLQRFLDKIILINLEKNQGKGLAVKEGLKRSTGNIIIIQDADLEINPKEYPKLIKPIIEKKTDVVYGSRILGKNPRKSLIFYLGGKFLTFLANLLYRVDITDQPTCYKVCRSEILKNMNLESRGFELCSEITAKLAKKGIKIYEVPISYNPRSKAEGKKVGILDGIKAALALIKYKFK